MTYSVQFKGEFVYPDQATAEKALEVIDQEEAHPDDDFEVNILGRDDFKLDGAKLMIDFDNFIPASSSYGCERVLCKMSADAVDGKIKFSYQDSPDQWIKAGRGWS